MIALLPVDVAELMEDVVTRPLRELPCSSIVALLLALCQCERQPDPGYHCVSTMPDSLDIEIGDGCSLTLSLTDWREYCRTRMILGLLDEAPTSDMPWYDIAPERRPKCTDAAGALTLDDAAYYTAGALCVQPKAHRCGDWNNGSCARGNACRFRHGSINDLCRFGEKCRDKENCRARHPKARSK